MIGEALKRSGTPFLVVEENDAIVDRLRKEGLEVYAGTAAQPDLLEAVNLPGAH